MWSLLILLTADKLRKLFWSSESELWHGNPFLLCLKPEMLRKQNNLWSNIYYIQKDGDKSGNGIKYKDPCYAFSFHNTRLADVQDVLTQRSTISKARGQQGHAEVLSTRGIFLTCRNFRLGFYERFISPNSPLRTLQRAGFLGLSPALQQREALSQVGASCSDGLQYLHGVFTTNQPKTSRGATR